MPAFLVILLCDFLYNPQLVRGNERSASPEVIVDSKLQEEQGESLKQTVNGSAAVEQDSHQELKITGELMNGVFSYQINKGFLDAVYERYKKELGSPATQESSRAAQRILDEFGMKIEREVNRLKRGARSARYEPDANLLKTAIREERRNRREGTAEEKEEGSMTKLKTILSFADVNIFGFKGNDQPFRVRDFQECSGGLKGTDALLAIDVQNGFIREHHARGGGQLPVPDGQQVVPAVRRLMSEFKESSKFFTRDFHPEGHVSFASSKKDGPWPDHCVRGTASAGIHKGVQAAMPADLRDRLKAECEGIKNGAAEEKDWVEIEKGDTTIVAKAYKEDVDAYSGFKGTNLNELMSKKGINRTFIVGLATDYCVMHSAIDAAVNGKNPVVVLGAVRGVDWFAGDLKKAIAKMKIMRVQFCPAI